MKSKQTVKRKLNFSGVLQVCLLCMLTTVLSCGNKTMIAQKEELTLHYFMGFWQNTDNAHNFILMSAASNGEGMWGSFPLEPDPLNPKVADTAMYYKNFCFMGGFDIKKDIVSCWYQDMDKQGVRIPGIIKVIGADKIKTPVGSFKKLSKEEVDRINPYLGKE